MFPHIYLQGNKRPGPNARIPLPTARSRFHLSTSPGLDLAMGSRGGRHSSSSSYHQPPPHHNAMTSTVGPSSRSNRQTKSGPAATAVNSTASGDVDVDAKTKNSGSGLGVSGVMARRAQSDGVVTTGVSKGGASYNPSSVSESSILNVDSAHGRGAKGVGRGAGAVPVNKPLPFANDESGEPRSERTAVEPK